MSKTIKDSLLLGLAVLVITFSIWLPHILAIPNFYGLDFSQGFNTIYRNFDGLEYVVIAKTFYDPNLIAGIPQQQPTIYYAAHFPGYALLISAFSPLFGALKSMLFVSVLSTIASAIIFYLLLKDFKLTSNPFWLSLVFLILPARSLVIHSVGSSEPLFIFFVLLALYFFLKFELSNRAKFIWLSGIFGAFAQITRPPGILLLIALSFYLFWKLLNENSQPFLSRLIKLKVTYLPLGLIPLSLLGIFTWFSLTYGNFWAYFYTGDNIHLTFPPYQVFNKFQFWVGDIWLEDIIYIYLLSFLGGILLIKQRLYPLAVFVLIYSVAAISIAHRDVSRYILPITPFLLIAFERTINTKEFKIVLAILAFGIYLYSQNFILANVAPIPNLEVFN